MAINVDISGSAVKLKQAFDAARGWARGFVSSISAPFGKLKGLFGGLGAALGVGLSVRAVKGLIDEFDNLGKSARNLGLTAEELQKLNYAAESVNLGADKVTTALPKMTKLIGDAANGSTQARKKLLDLGLSLETLSGKSTQQQLDQVARAITGISDPARRTAAAMSVFGEEGAKMLNFLGEYRTLGRDLEHSGRLVSNDQIQAAEKFNQALTDIGTSIKAGLMNSGLVEWLSDVAGELEKISRNTPGTLVNRPVSPAVRKNDGLTRLRSNRGNAMNDQLREQTLSDAARSFEGMSIDALREFDFDAWRQELSRELEEKFAETRRSEGERLAGVAGQKALAAQVRVQVDESDLEALDETINRLLAPVRAADADAIVQEEVTRKLREQLQLYDEQLHLQQLKNLGLEREASIQEELRRVRKALGVEELSDDQIRTVRESAGALFDARQQTEAEAQQKALSYSTAARPATRLEEIGGMLAGGNFGRDTVPGDVGSIKNLTQDIKRELAKPVPVSDTHRLAR